MIKKTVSRILGLLLIPAIVVSVCGWSPFTAPVTIHSVPEGADVCKAGEAEVLGTTPYSTRVFHFDKHFEIKKDKFHTGTITVDYNTMEEVYVTLNPAPVLVYTKIDADIYEAGAAAPFGKTPIEVEVQMEPRTCTLKRTDYFDKEITIGMETENPIVTELKRRPIVTLTTAPAGVEIYEKGSLFATSTMREEISVPRTFELRKEDYYSKTLNLTPTSAPEMNVSLDPLPVITIETDPAGADVYMVGKDVSIGKSPLTLRIETATGFEARSDRYYSKSITVQPKTQTASIELEAMPYVTISSKPSGAKVTLGGKTVGTTPVEQLIETATAAELTLDGYQTKTVTLTGSDLNPTITLEEIVVVAAPVVEEVVAEPVVEKKKGFFSRLFGK